MITYNHEKYIAQAINGVLMQKCDFHFELVIGEDHSTDGTREICKMYAEKYPEIIKLLTDSGRNLGANQNFIRTFNACTGKYIAMCEGDDFWTDSNKLRLQFQFLESNPGFTFVSHGYITINKDNEVIAQTTLELSESYPEGIKIDENNVFDTNLSLTLTLLFRRDVFNEPIFVKYKNATDTVLLSHLIANGNGYWLSINCGAYRIHETNSWANKDIECKLLKGLEIFLDIKKVNDVKISSIRTIIINYLYYIVNFYIHPNNRSKFKWKRIIRYSFKILLEERAKLKALAYICKEVFPILMLKLKMNVRKKLNF